MSAASFPRRLLRENVVLLLVAMVVVLPLLMPLTHGISGRNVRNELFQSMAVLLLVVLLARVELGGGLPRLLYLVRSGVNAPLAALLLWAALGALRSPDRAFAVGELLRLASGALVYFALVLHLETRAQLSLLIDCLLGIVILITGYGFLFQGTEAANGIASVFPNRHHLSAVLTVLFPLLASLALGVREHRRRITAIVAAILGAAGLLLCLERSAWIAVTIGLSVWLFLATRSRAPDAHRWRWRAALVIIAAGFLLIAGFLTVTGVDTLLAERARDVSTAIHGRDDSFEWRVHKWRGAAAMVARRPVWGWGPGEFVLYQSTFTRISSYPGNDPATERAEVRRFGASFDDMAYNEYLQTAAELGLPGLALYLLVLASFFSKSGRALPRLPDGLRRATLMGCMAGVAAQMVDAMANGSWRYAECSIFFWLVLGLGAAVTRMAYQSVSPSVRRPPESSPLPMDLPSARDDRPMAPPAHGVRSTRSAGTRA